MYHALITALYTQLGLPLPVAGQTATTLAINDELVLRWQRMRAIW